MRNDCTDVNAREYREMSEYKLLLSPLRRRDSCFSAGRPLKDLPHAENRELTPSIHQKLKPLHVPHMIVCIQCSRLAHFL